MHNSIKAQVLWDVPPKRKKTLGSSTPTVYRFPGPWKADLSRDYEWGLDLTTWRHMTPS